MEMDTLLGGVVFLVMVVVSIVRKIQEQRNLAKREDEPPVLTRDELRPEVRKRLYGDETVRQARPKGAPPVARPAPVREVRTLEAGGEGGSRPAPARPAMPLSDDPMEVVLGKLVEVLRPPAERPRPAGPRTQPLAPAPPRAQPAAQAKRRPQPVAPPPIPGRTAPAARSLERAASPPLRRPAVELGHSLESDQRHQAESKRMQQAELSSAPRQSGGAPKPASTAAKHGLKAFLGSKNDLRHGIILSEILGSPKSLQ